MNFFRAPNTPPYPLDEPHSFVARADAPNLCRFCGNRRGDNHHIQEPAGHETGQLLEPSTSDERRASYVEPLDRVALRRDLNNVFDYRGVGAWLGISDDLAAQKIIEFLELVKECHDACLPMATLEPLMPDTGATVARHRTVYIGQHDVTTEPQTVTPLEVPKHKWKQDEPEDWCACGWSDDPHLRSEHAPAGVFADHAPTPPHAACSKFVSEIGVFASSPESLCARCGASGYAHGITKIGPPSQIAETLTPLED